MSNSSLRGRGIEKAGVSGTSKHTPHHTLITPTHTHTHTHSVLDAPILNHRFLGRHSKANGVVHQLAILIANCSTRSGSTREGT